MNCVKFTIFIDDIDEKATLIDMLIKFADDTKGLKEINGPEDTDKLQKILNNLYQWAKDWGMEFKMCLNVKSCMSATITPNMSTRWGASGSLWWRRKKMWESLFTKV